MLAETTARFYNKREQGSVMIRRDRSIVCTRKGSAFMRDFPVPCGGQHV
jgi:hypothetical protein